MSKELEALENLTEISIVLDKQMRAGTELNFSLKNSNDYKIIKSALQRLEAIDNVNASEALGRLIILASELGTSKDMKFAENRFPKMIITIQQALQKAQEQEKVLEIIKKKRVDLPYLRCCFEDNQSVERYNEYIGNKTMDYDHEKELSEEEFDLLKRYCNEQDNK